MNVEGAIISGTGCISNPTTYHPIPKENQMTSKIISEPAATDVLVTELAAARKTLNKIGKLPKYEIEMDCESVHFGSKEVCDSGDHVSADDIRSLLDDFAREFGDTS